MRTRLPLTALTLLACTSGLFAQVDDAKLDAQLAAYQEGRAAIFAERPENMLGALQDVAREALGDTDVASMSLEQVIRLLDSGSMNFVPREMAEAVLKRLEEIARNEEEPAVDRALAAAAGGTFDVTGFDGEYVAPEWATDLGAALFAEFLESPARNELLTGEHAMFAMEAMLRPSADKPVPASRVVTIIDSIGDAYPLEAVNGPRMLWGTASDMAEREEGALSADDRERARLFCIAWAEAGEAHYRAKSQSEDAEERDGDIADYLADSVAGMTSRAAMGKLIGYPTPDISIRWSSDESITSLADLEGKVVLLDFFATWCGPCIQTFPQVRELREKYSEDELAIVMITSPQGSVYNLDPAPIDCEGDPEKEIGLMARFMEHHDITWTMAVMGEGDEVFHPDFGVRGIPHVAIIDAKGNVRYNGLHPMDPSKKEKIDGLLAEAKDGTSDG